MRAKTNLKEFAPCAATLTRRITAVTFQGATATAEERASLADALMRITQDDNEALNEVYRATSAKLFSICFAVCGDYQAAQDVLNEVYMLVWKRAGTFDPTRGSAIAWLAKIAQNRSIDWRRAQRDQLGTPIDSALDPVDPSPCAESVLLSDEQYRAVHRCLGLLHAHQRAAIAAAFFYGATYAELAIDANVPLGTMKSWVRRGLAQMKQQLESVR